MNIHFPRATGCVLSSEHGERLAAILAADVASSCRLIAIDEEGTLAQLKALIKTLFDPKITNHRGRIVKNTGDGIQFSMAWRAFDLSQKARHRRRHIVFKMGQAGNGEKP